ncbi:MarR family transcriptional regulator [Peteryoungia desertarenae]|uniref:MarR family transcriptional regulator n=1 Tax=Peteryoungia desertarenae TaxID=1813451 RepID=A0ABX6QIH4_9HYPH|nr:MarR family transcriptional regulator [Peteryoungia desertarenae]QLF68161.1 MarR family transcriptional regulator [Peteryoungia desertarenae]
MAKKDKADKAGKEQKKASKKKEAASHSGALAATITQVARSLRTRLSHSLADSGLYPGQDGVIQLLAAEEGLTPGHLAQRLGVKAPTMTRTIGRMEAQGFVMRRTDGTDGRLTKVYLTDDGRNSLAKINDATDECLRLATRGLSGKDVKSLVKLLSEVDANLQSVLRDEKGRPGVVENDD